MTFIAFHKISEDSFIIVTNQGVIPTQCSENMGKIQTNYQNMIPIPNITYSNLHQNSPNEFYLLLASY